MINFKDEIMKYEPVLEVDEIENNIRSNEMKDIFDILHYMTKKMTQYSTNAQGNSKDKE